MKRLRRKTAIALAILLILSLPPGYPAMAEVIEASSPAYISTSTPNTTITDRYMLANSALGDPPLASDPGVYFTEIIINWSVQPGDQVGVLYYDYTGYQVGMHMLNAGEAEPPFSVILSYSEIYATKLQLITSSSSGSRYLWYVSTTNSSGVTVNFPAPDIGGGGGTADLDDVIDELKIIEGQLGNILGTLQAQLAAIQGELNQISSQLTTITSQLETANNYLSQINSKVQAIHSYLTTPRPTSLTFARPTAPIFDPTPPVQNEPIQQPYTYDRTLPTMPPSVASPGPLPTIPNPVAMPHDEPLSVEVPRQLTPHLNRDTPLQLDPVQMDPPRTRDPVSVEPPVTPQDPLTPSAPMTRSSPPTREAPIQRDPPLARDTPTHPNPPLN